MPELLPTLPALIQAAYAKAPNFGEASDILRYGLLLTQGGLYVDTDFECVQSVEALHKVSANPKECGKKMAAQRPYKPHCLLHGRMLYNGQRSINYVVLPPVGMFSSLPFGTYKYLSLRPLRYCL